MRDLTIVFPYFRNLGMVLEQQRVWDDYPPELKSRLHIIVVDDCSEKGSLSWSDVTATGLASIRLFRLLKKIRWNWLACRNLGAEMAKTEWLLLTDIDHVVPPGTLNRLMTGPVENGAIYRFNRVTADRAWPYDLRNLQYHKPHNDTWFLRKRLFFSKNVGGYDERLSGCYGTSSEFTYRLQSAASAHIVLEEQIVRYPREVIKDASTSPDVYTRKGDEKNDADLKRRKNERDLIKHWKPLRGLTPWEEILPESPGA
jgi:glycosyltransferase involved in cell wall biosynthesis